MSENGYGKERIFNGAQFMGASREILDMAKHLCEGQSPRVVTMVANTFLAVAVVELRRFENKRDQNWLASFLARASLGSKTPIQNELGCFLIPTCALASHRLGMTTLWGL